MSDAKARFLLAVDLEVQRATAKHAPMHSPHEAYSVILEEVDEFWDEVRKQSHNPSDMYTELIHVAAMATRAATDLLDGEVWHG